MDEEGFPTSELTGDALLAAEEIGLGLIICHENEIVSFVI